MKDIPLMNESFTNLTFTKAGVEGVEQSGYQAAVKPCVLQIFQLLLCAFVTKCSAESLSHP
jgi:hypothetical protein